MDFTNAGMILLQQHNKPFCGIVHDCCSRPIELAKMIDKLSYALTLFKECYNDNPKDEQDWLRTFCYYGGWGYAFILDKEELTKTTKDKEVKKIIPIDIEEPIITLSTILGHCCKSTYEGNVFTELTTFVEHCEEFK